MTTSSTRTFTNNTGMPHNVAPYTDGTATTKIFAGDQMTGIRTVTCIFIAPSVPGNYFFRCDVHPELLTGTLVVTGKTIFLTGLFQNLFQILTVPITLIQYGGKYPSGKGTAVKPLP
jgi:hypothetical protein